MCVPCRVNLVISHPHPCLPSPSTLFLPFRCRRSVSLSHAAVTCPSEAALAAEESEKTLEKEKTGDKGQTKSEKQDENEDEDEGEQDEEAGAERGAASSAEGGDDEAAALDKGEVDGEHDSSAHARDCVCVYEVCHRLQSRCAVEGRV